MRKLLVDLGSGVGCWDSGDTWLNLVSILRWSWETYWYDERWDEELSIIHPWSGVVEPVLCPKPGDTDTL